MSDTDVILDFKKFLFSGKPEEIKELCSTLHPATVADALSDLPASEVWKALSYCDVEDQAEIFSHLDEDIQVELIKDPDQKMVKQIVNNMYIDDLVDLIKHSSEEVKETILPSLPAQDQETVKKLSSYPEGTAGSIMTSEYMTLRDYYTVDEAITAIRKEAPNKETIYYSYVIDDEGKLLGFVSLQDIMLAPSASKIGEIMSQEYIYARVDDDQEEVTHKIAKFDLIALPVVNGDNKLVGIVTHDDALDILNQEYTEDIEKLMAISGSHEAGVYLRTSSWDHYKNRIFWLMGLAFIGLISGYIIHRFESALSSMIMLAFYIPMMVDTGGNTGSQSATVVIRALALKEITPKDTFRVLFKEFKISLMLALTLGALAFVNVSFLSRSAQIPEGYTLGIVGFAIALSLSIQVISSAFVGTVLPLVVSKLKFDPAVVASPAITTIVDITGLIIYFSVAKAVLQL